MLSLSPPTRVLCGSLQNPFEELNWKSLTQRWQVWFYLVQIWRTVTLRAKMVPRGEISAWNRAIDWAELWPLCHRPTWMTGQHVRGPGSVGPKKKTTPSSPHPHLLSTRSDPRGRSAEFSYPYYFIFVIQILCVRERSPQKYDCPQPLKSAVNFLQLKLTQLSTFCNNYWSSFCAKFGGVIISAWMVSRPWKMYWFNVLHIRGYFYAFIDHLNWGIKSTGERVRYKILHCQDNKVGSMTRMI